MRTQDAFSFFRPLQRRLKAPQFAGNVPFGEFADA